MTKWLETLGKDEDVVVSTRLRVARNIEKYKFPELMSIEEVDALTEEVLDAVKDSKYKYKFYRTKDLPYIERSMFVEEHLISPTLLKTAEKSSFLLSEDEKSTIMINEEDHIRIQVVLSGSNMEEGWKICSEIDDLLEKNIEYSFHEKFGYLTSCPTNVGTGLRASVMVHLPCVSMTGHLNIMMEALRKIGLTVRGIYGEGTKGLGNLYQISNQTTLGEKEEDIIKKLNKVIYQIVTRERSTRKYLEEKKGLQLQDKIFRSLGIIKHSRLISSKEAMLHLSNVKLGCDMGIIKGMSSKEIVKLMIEIQPASIQINMAKDMIKEERDMNRSQIIRNQLTRLEG